MRKIREDRTERGKVGAGDRTRANEKRGDEGGTFQCVLDPPLENLSHILKPSVVKLVWGTLIQVSESPTTLFISVTVYIWTGCTLTIKFQIGALLVTVEECYRTNSLFWKLVN